MFGLGPYARLPAVLLALTFGESLVVKSLLVGEVTRFRCGLVDKLLLAGIGKVAIYPMFVAVQQLGDGVFVIHVGRCGNLRGNQLGLAVHADVSLHAEVPLIFLLGLMHLRVARLALVLGRGHCIDDRRIHDGAGRYLQSHGLQMSADFLEQALPHSMLFQQVAELVHRGFVRRTFPSQIDANEFAHGQRVVERFFHRRVGEVEPVLEKVVRSMRSRPTGGRPFPALG